MDRIIKSSMKKNDDSEKNLLMKLIYNIPDTWQLHLLSGELSWIDIMKFSW